MAQEIFNRVSRDLYLSKRGSLKKAKQVAIKNEHAFEACMKSDRKYLVQ